MKTIFRGTEMHNLAEIFKRERVNGKSQKEAAEYLGIDHRSVSRHMKQKNIGLDVLQKYAEYLNVNIEDFVSQKVSRQINGYVKDGIIHFYKENEERPRIYGLFAASWWWSDKGTILIIDKNDPKGVYYNMLNFYSQWLSVVRIKDQATGLYQDKETDKHYGGAIFRKSDDEFICRNFYETYTKTTKLKRYAKWICSYNLDDLPLHLE